MNPESPDAAPAAHSETAGDLESFKRRKEELEVQKLEIENDRMRSEAALTRKKLELEIADLSRPAWLRPGLVLPVVAALATFLFAASQDLFKILSQKNENELNRIAIEKRHVELEKSVLTQDVKLLEKTKSELAAANQAKAEALAKAEKAEQRAVLAYPALRLNRVQRLLQEFEKCPLVAQISLLEYRIRLTTPPSAQEALPGDSSRCHMAVVNSANYLSDLSAADRRRLARIIESFMTFLNSGRESAIAAYLDPTAQSPFQVALSPTDLLVLKSPTSRLSDAEQQEINEGYRKVLLLREFERQYFQLHNLAKRFGETGQ